jgi:integrase
MNAVSRVKSGERPFDDFSFWKSYVHREFPNTIKALCFVDSERASSGSRKGYALVKRSKRKEAAGYVYYARFYHAGKILPSQWNTRTSVLEDAERFARENRTRIIEEYLSAHEKRDLKFFDDFFKDDSVMPRSENKRNGRICDKWRVACYHHMRNRFVPFLEERRVFSFSKIDTRLLSDFQDALLASGLKPQTVNGYLKAVRKVFSYLARKGMVNTNPCKLLPNIPVYAEDQAVRGCYEIGRLAGIFRRKWEDEESYLLCLLIYTTGMRNCEIQPIKKEDMVTVEGCHFIDIKDSKTANGIRLVPLHDFVYRKLMAYGAGKEAGARLFEINDTAFRTASAALARRLGAEDEIGPQNITFYSGRHFWKTLMNSEGLGEVEELFMGHKVSSDVSKRYNHRDKRGKELLAQKAREVFSILDRNLFTMRR